MAGGRGKPGGTTTEDHMPSRRRELGSANLTRPLRNALITLQAERARLDRQISGIEQVLDVLSGTLQSQKEGPATRRTPKRRPMSAKARKAVSQRMKAYWAKRRGAAAKEKPKEGA